MTLGQNKRLRTAVNRTVEILSLEPRLLFSTTLAGIPALDSDPGARAKIYLDFNGAPATTWGGYSVPATPAYNIDGDATTFSAQELANAQEIWARVSEKYSPFNIDVTTVDPGTYTPGQIMRVVIGGDGSWSGGLYGGLSYTGSFTTSLNTSWVFSVNLGNGDPHYTAEATAHEAGHELGLNHQSDWSGSTLVSEYSHGNSLAAPIMGNSYYAPRGLWWYGTSDVSSTTMQDDMSVIASSSNGFGYRPQDHGQTIATANPLTLVDSNVSGSGIIANTSDTDFFSFTTGAGTITLNGNVAQYGATLDLKLVLMDNSGNVIATADTASLGESLTVTLPGGSYRLEVASHGGYGDVGQYTISGTIVPPAGYVSPPTNLIGAVDPTSGQVSLNWTESSTPINGFDIQRSTDGGATWLDIGQTDSSTLSYVDSTTAPGGNYQYRVDALASTGNSDFSVPISETVAPGAPSGLNAASISGSQIALNWTAGAGAGSYVVQRSLDGINWTSVANTSSTSFQDNSLAGGTTYYYQVFASAGGTTSGASNISSATTAVTPLPNAPSNLTANTNGRGKIRLNWTDSYGDMTGYLIQFSRDGQSWSQLASVSASTNSYMGTGFKRGVVYFFRVFASNSAGLSPASNVASVTAAALVAPNHRHDHQELDALPPIGVTSANKISSAKLSNGNTSRMAQLLK